MSGDVTKIMIEKVLGTKWVASSWKAKICYRSNSIPFPQSWTHWQVHSERNGERSKKALEIWYRKHFFGIMRWWDSRHMVLLFLWHVDYCHRPETWSFTNNPNGVSWTNIYLYVHSAISTNCFRALEICSRRSPPIKIEPTEWTSVLLHDRVTLN